MPGDDADIEVESITESATVQDTGSQVPRPKRWKRTKNQEKKDTSFSRDKTAGSWDWPGRWILVRVGAIVLGLAGSSS